MPVRNVRRRYLAIRVHSESSVSEEDLLDAINQKIHYLYGVKGASEINLKMIEYSPEEKHGILRCSHNRLTEMRAALAHITSINNIESSIHVIRVSGTIKTLRKKLALPESK
ncbi:MAG: Rpp14/Pop5 family protein [Candidatus Bathyarchaeota archaeon]|nr:Rpp14/Pop5 family protein [Candidatus Bathyarchaeota archaeon]